LIEGFNSLNISFEALDEILASSYLRGHFVLGIGKAEWADIKWSDQSIATKKDLVNRAGILFTAFQDSSLWPSHVEALRDAGVNHRLLDCSDAHYFSDAEQHERLGNCRTWLNTTPTFAGLVHALAEFERRVYVGLEPPTLVRIRRSPERFIDRVSIRSEDPATNDAFDYSLPLNPGFVAIIGNKGQGKSALLDCIALAGNSSRSGEFAFLNGRRFLSPSNRSAREYYSEIDWATGATRRAQFGDSHDRSAAVSVEYLPQKFVERVCNADPLAGETDEFEEELRNVLFTHIPEEERAGEKSFDSLLRSRTRTSRETVERLRSGLRPLIAEYARLARFRSHNVLSDIESRLDAKRGEIAAAKVDLQAATDELSELDAGREDDSTLGALRARSELLEADRVAATQARQETERISADLQRRLLAMDAVLGRVEDPDTRTCSGCGPATAVERPRSSG
jgi:energy-coupling factor transporter ATP-binding protein EcfA2